MDIGCLLVMVAVLARYAQAWISTKWCSQPHDVAMLMSSARLELQHECEQLRLLNSQLLTARKEQARQLQASEDGGAALIRQLREDSELRLTQAVTEVEERWQTKFDSAEREWQTKFDSAEREWATDKDNEHKRLVQVCGFSSQLKTCGSVGPVFLT